MQGVRNRGILVLIAISFWSVLSLGGMRRIYELPAVEYPEACLDRHIQGTVVLNFKVNSHGKIEDIRVIKEVPACPEFTGAALSAARHARFFPPPPGVRLLRQSIEIPVTFSVSETQETGG